MRARSKGSTAGRYHFFFGGGDDFTGAAFASFFGFFFSLLCELLPLPIARTSVRERTLTTSTRRRYYRVAAGAGRDSALSPHVATGPAVAIGRTVRDGSSGVGFRLAGAGGLGRSRWALGADAGQQVGGRFGGAILAREFGLGRHQFAA